MIWIIKQKRNEIKLIGSCPCLKKTFFWNIIIIVTPLGSLFFLCTFFTLFNAYRYRYESRWFLQVDALAGTRSWDLWWSVGFSSYLCLVADSVPFCYTIAVGRIHICKVVFLPILARWLTRSGVMLRFDMRTMVCTPVFPRQDSNSRPHHWP